MTKQETYKSLLPQIASLVDGHTQILSNQFGYLSHGEPQHNGFDPKRCITI